MEPVQVEEWHTGVPPAEYDGPGGPGRHYRMPRWCAGNWPGDPGVEVAGLSREKVEEQFWDTITQVGADLAGVPRKRFPLFGAPYRKTWAW